MLTDTTKRNINFDLEEQGKETRIKAWWLATQTPDPLGNWKLPLHSKKDLLPLVRRLRCLKYSFS